VTLDWANMHGDVIAICADDPATTGTTNYSESTEFGAPRDAASAPDTYGWLGTKRRSTNDIGGLTLMGIRLYNPATGRFLSVDPIPGGNDNAYLYVTNPVDYYDVSGKAAARRPSKKFLKCRDLAQKIGKQRDRVARRARQLRENVNDWEMDSLEYRGHVEAFENDQRGLRNLLQQWDSCGCGSGGGSVGSNTWTVATASYLTVAAIKTLGAIAVMGMIIVGIFTWVAASLA